MKTTDLFPLMDSCRTSGEQLNGLLEAIEHSHGKLSDSALSSCISLSQSLCKKQADTEARLFDVVQQLNIINSAVNGGGA